MKLLYENISERYYFRMFDNMTFPAHLHPELEILLLQSGSMEVTVGRQQQSLAPGQLAVAFPHQIHSYKTQSDSHGILIICPPSSFGEFQDILTLEHPDEPFIPASSVHSDILFSMESMLQINDTLQSGFPLARAYIHLLLARLLPCLTLLKNRDSLPANQTMQLIAYLSEHFTEQITLQTLADQLHISRYSVSRIFSEKLDTSFPRYLNTLRIDHAQKLLRVGKTDMLTVSECCGYETLRTFNREFRLHCGCSPREFQKAVRASLEKS